MGGAAWATLDLSPDFSFRLSKDVQALSDVNEILTDGVLPFSVPYSTVNDYAFLPFSSPVTVNNTGAGIEARAECDGVQLNFDTVYFRQKSDSSRTWELEFRRSPGHWLELASNKMLNTIECGELVFSVANAEASWDAPVWADGEPVYSLCPADFGGWVDLAEPVQFTDPPLKSVYLEDLRPIISVPYLLKQGFCEVGWKLGGLILETEWFNSLWVYILSREYHTQSKGGDAKLIGANLTTDVNPSGGIFAGLCALTSIEYDPGSNAIATGLFWWPGLINPLPYKNIVSFCFSGTIENGTGSSETVELSVIEIDTGTFLPTYQYLVDPQLIVTLGAGESQYVEVCLDAPMEIGQMGVLFFPPTSNVTVKAGYRLTVVPKQKSLIRGDTIQLNRLVSGEENYTLLNLFKGVCQLINARIETDFTSREITLHPYRVSDVYGTVVPGFIDDASIVDLRGKVICESAKLAPVKNTLTRYTRLAFAPTTDAYIDDLNLPEPPYSRKVLNGLELKDQVTEIANEFFEPTLEGRPDRLRFPKQSVPTEMPYLPRMWDNTDGEMSFSIAPRIFFHYGNVEQVPDAASGGARIAIFWERIAILDYVTQFGYVSQKRTLDFSASTPTHLDGNVVFGTLPFDLYVQYWLGYLLSQRRGSLMDVLAWMDMNDWQDWNFREPFSFDYDGVPVKAFLQSIRDFAPATDLPTPLTLLVAPMMTECCDLPCSCRFSECSYFQDLGQYLSQSTLDSLEITSFKVNTVEQLTAPVDLGIVNIVSIAGRPFVTNLIDALNGIGIPYFTFSPSQLDYPEKDDWRYFKIKRPACWSFEIIISDGDGEVYRYTDTETLQKWFDEDWTGFGYEENLITEPQGCVVSVEY